MQQDISGYDVGRGSIPQTSKIVKNKKLERQMHATTAFFTALGAIGVLAAIYISLYVHPVSVVNISIFLGFYIAVGCGLTIGYHRYFTHKSFKATPVVTATLGVLGSMAGQGPIIFWAALHRRHHQTSDREGDPHSPHLIGDGFWNRCKGVFHAYIGWTVKHEVPNPNHYARDLLADPLVASLNRKYFFWVLLGLALPAAIGGLVEGTLMGALEGLIWGGLIRMFALHNMIWWITSFSHVFGTRDYASRDYSTNNFWLAIPMLGENWHNNHHAFPGAASLNFKWWQIDISGALVGLLEKCNLVSNVNRPTKTSLEKKILKERLVIKHPLYVEGKAK